MPLFFILLLLVLAGCGQKKVAVTNEPAGKSDSSSASSAVAEKISSSEKAADGKPEEEKLFTDSRDGKKYKTVVIGGQTWMAKNLNFNASGSKCYDNKPANCDKYGRLYDWATAMKACPKGWHLPSNAEWDKLYRFADSSGSGSPYISEKAGKYLKAVSGWSNKGNGTDVHGFSALPGGMGHYNGNFDAANLSGIWWSADEYDHDFYAYNRHIISADEVAYWSYNDKNSLFSVRCLQN